MSVSGAVVVSGNVASEEASTNNIETQDFFNLNLAGHLSLTNLEESAAAAAVPPKDQFIYGADLAVQLTCANSSHTVTTKDGEEIELGSPVKGAARDKVEGFASRSFNGQMEECFYIPITNATAYAHYKYELGPLGGASTKVRAGLYPIESVVYTYDHTSAIMGTRNDKGKVNYGDGLQRPDFDTNVGMTDLYPPKFSFLTAIEQELGPVTISGVYAAAGVDPEGKNDFSNLFNFDQAIAAGQVAVNLESGNHAFTPRAYYSSFTEETTNDIGQTVKPKGAYGFGFTYTYDATLKLTGAYGGATQEIQGDSSRTHLEDSGYTATASLALAEGVSLILGISGATAGGRISGAAGSSSIDDVSEQTIEGAVVFSVGNFLPLLDGLELRLGGNTVRIEKGEALLDGEEYGFTTLNAGATYEVASW